MDTEVISNSLLRSKSFVADYSYCLNSVDLLKYGNPLMHKAAIERLNVSSYYIVKYFKLFLPILHFVANNNEILLSEVQEHYKERRLVKDLSLLKNLNSFILLL